MRPSLLLLVLTSCTTLTAPGAPDLVLNGSTAMGVQMSSDEINEAARIAEANSANQRTVLLSDVRSSDVYLPDGATMHLAVGTLQGMGAHASTLFAPDMLEDSLQDDNPIVGFGGATASVRDVEYQRIQAAVDTADDLIQVVVTMHDVAMIAELHSLFGRKVDFTFDKVQIDARFSIDVSGDDLLVEVVGMNVELEGADFPYVPDIAWLESKASESVEGFLADRAREKVPARLEDFFEDVAKSVASGVDGWSYQTVASMSSVAVDYTGITAVFDIGMTLGHD